MFACKEAYGNIEFSDIDKIKVIEFCRKHPDKDMPLKLKKEGDHYIIASYKASKDDGEVFAQEVLQVLKKQEPRWFQDVETFMIDRELFLVYLSQLLFDIPALINKFETIYQENSLEYYEVATTSKYYSHRTLNDGNLMGDVAIKRTYGVLLAAENNTQVRNKAERIFFEYDKELKQLIEDQSCELVERLSHSLYRGDTALSSHIFAYLLLNRYDGTYSPVLNYFARLVSDTDNVCEKRGTTNYTRAYVESENDPFDYLEFSSNYVWKIIKETLSFNDILSMTMAYEYDLGIRHDEPYNPKIYELITKCPESDPCYEEIQKALDLIWAFGSNVNLNGLASIRLFFGKTITKSKQKEILREYVWNHKQLEKLLGKKPKVRLRLDSYVALLLLYFFVQNEIEVKKVFFENNNETMFSHMSILNGQIEQLQKENEDLLEQVDKMREEIEFLHKENEKYSVAAKKETKDNGLPYIEEILQLQRQNTTLSRRLFEEKEKDKELNALREFAFAVQSKYVANEAEINLPEVTRKKKILIIGGHINWRNNLKKKYPSISVMDGHLETADFSVLKNMDFVFLNVSNMSHSVYYKVINILRNSTTPFDYLGRTINQELYEKEMADILLRNEMKTTK